MKTIIKKTKKTEISLATTFAVLSVFCSIYSSDSYFEELPMIKYGLMSVAGILLIVSFILMSKSLSKNKIKYSDHTNKQKSIRILSIVICIVVIVAGIIYATQL